MPDLPTLTVTQAQADRILATFGTAAAYRDWLRARVIDAVMAFESRKLDETANNDKATKLKAIRDALPPDP